MPFAHNYPFDPTYGYSLDGLRAVTPPPEPADFGLDRRSGHPEAGVQGFSLGWTRTKAEALDSRI
ncbi:hypothetical protein [uncultured Thiodictyon sp.]|uniref:hypothetical protein n=1 Tax=uncultured Thiodictyon sp. TaxID=1846217 RepID=UPI0025F4F699|nr:hypothetical protein [uncultured Thiodictyon sp.]